ncbi:MurR/RpiR family transcriptional regulator [Leucobacter sp. wl10]|uniref:MurR/RpiR family transcriptional regulator n=1 Tax=Leucobacter sp. wl10 TaxID=2304677 RepID=UPI000E5AB726|nr:MurR/RpiR family transcriptional regulator [Leucobacter sp. wl10]RGE19210.1 MurR/RpiR family transcriptional regulator [Leucobacter sp. wl10]
MSIPASPPIGGTRALLQSHAPSLVPSERRVAQVCIDEPDRVVDMSVADLARRAGVSPATVVRACKRMGFAGFQRLRELLIRDQAAPAAAGAAGAAPEHPVERIFERAVAGINGALGALDFDAFDAAALGIRDCSRLLVVGNGASLAAAQSVALRFLTSGKVCESPVDIVTQHIAAKLLRPGDVCLAVSDSGMNHFTLRSARLAAESGAMVIAITSYGRSELAEIADYALVAGAGFHSWNDNTVTGNIVQMLLLSALHAAALGTAPAAIAARAEVFDEVRTMMRQGA